MKKIIAFSFLYLSFFAIADAHGGRTDSSGGHNCRTGSCAGTYHYHGRKPVAKSVYVPPPVKNKTVSAPVVDPKPSYVPPVRNIISKPIITNKPKSVGSEKEKKNEIKLLKENLASERNKNSKLEKDLKEERDSGGGGYLGALLGGSAVYLYGKRKKQKLSNLSDF